MLSGATTRGGHVRLAVAVATAWLVLLAFVAFVRLGSWPDILFESDFVSFWSAGALVRDGAGPNLFDMETQRAFQERLRIETATTERVRLATGQIPYYNPPPLALLFLPLTLLPMPWAYLIWSAVSLLAFLAAVALPLRGVPGARSMAVVMLAFGGATDSLLEGQVNVLFLLAFSLALLALSSGRPALGGALLGLLWLKPQYALLFALLFLFKRRWRELAGMACTVVGIAVLSLAMVGPAGIAGQIEVLLRIGGPVSQPSLAINPDSMVNWRALLVNFWSDVPETTGAVLVVALGAATALASLLAWPGKWDASSPRFARQMLVIALATIVATPHSYFHGTMLLLAPLALALARPTEGGAMERAWRPMLALGYLLALVVWPARALSWILAPYFLLAMGLLIVQSRGDLKGRAEA